MKCERCDEVGAQVFALLQDEHGKVVQKFVLPFARCHAHRNFEVNDALWMQLAMRFVDSTRRNLKSIVLPLRDRTQVHYLDKPVPVDRIPVYRVVNFKGREHVEKDGKIDAYDSAHPSIKLGLKN